MFFGVFVVGAFFLSTGIVSLAEIGDKTQLLALVLAARYRRPLMLVLAIFLATIVNHALAGWLGLWVSQLFAPNTMAWILGLGFLIMAVWMLIPDKLDDDDATSSLRSHSVFMLCFVTFFLAEMGDKTQIATVALVAEYQQYWAVVLGTTLGMMVVNAPTVFVGDKLSGWLSLAWVHRASAAIFLVLAIVAISRALSMG